MQPLNERRGVVDSKRLMYRADALRVEAREMIWSKIAADDSKHRWLTKIMPRWTSKRPWDVVGLETRSSIALRQWLLGESNLAVEVGR